MDQIICAYFSHTHYCYEVSMLKVYSMTVGLYPILDIRYYTVDPMRLNYTGEPNNTSQVDLFCSNQSKSSPTKRFDIMISLWTVWILVILKLIINLI